MQEASQVFNYTRKKFVSYLTPFELVRGILPLSLFRFFCRVSSVFTFLVGSLPQFIGLKISSGRV